MKWLGRVQQDTEKAVKVEFDLEDRLKSVEQLGMNRYRRTGMTVIEQGTNNIMRC